MPLRDVRSTCFPYCLDRQTDGSYVIVNREYKPLGWTEREHVRYEEYPIRQRIKGLTPAKARKLSHTGSDELGCIYLYGDGCVPGLSKQATADYLKRLEVLLSLEIETDDT